MWRTAFKKFERVWSAWRRPCPFKFFKGYPPQILFGPFLNTLSYLPSRSLWRKLQNMLNAWKIEYTHRAITFIHYYITGISLELMIIPPFFAGGQIFRRICALGEMSNLPQLEGCVKKLSESFARGGIVSIWLTNTFSSNLNTINLKIFLNHGRVHIWEKIYQIFLRPLNSLNTEQSLETYKELLFNINLKGLLCHFSFLSCRP